MNEPSSSQSHFATGSSPAFGGAPPQLGTPIPGTTGGLPAKPGLSVAKNPMAEELRSKGRGEDSMLVHMTPGEVGGLQQLAMAHGGSLTINPETGLPEAGFLNKILPTLLGIGLTFIPGVGPLAAAGIVGAGQTALTGDIRKGLMAGLGAYGGASLAGALAPAAAGNAVTSSLAANAAPAATGTTAGSVLGAANAPVISGALGGGTLAVPGTTLPSFAAPSLAGVAGKTGLAGIAQRFGTEAAGGLGTGMLAKAAPYAAGYGLLGAVSDATTPTMRMPEPEKSKWDYKGPYLPQPRRARFQTPEQMRQSGGAEFNYFEDSNPYPGFMPAPNMADGGLASLPASADFQQTMDFFNSQNPGAITASMRPTETPTLPAAPSMGAGEKSYDFARGAPPVQMPYMGGGADTQPYYGGGFMGMTPFGGNMARYDNTYRDQDYAKGGNVDMEDGSFVVDARTVSEIGNGSSNAGIERLAGMGGRPVRGRGDGVSDSVPARIGGRQEARVARDEVIFSPDAVARVGGGDHSKGTKKLYALMDKAHKARKKAARGQDTKVAKGLEALA